MAQEPQLMYVDFEKGPAEPVHLTPLGQGKYRVEDVFDLILDEYEQEVEELRCHDVIEGGNRKRQAAVRSGGPALRSRTPPILDSARFVPIGRNATAVALVTRTGRRIATFDARLAIGFDSQGGSGTIHLGVRSDYGAIRASEASYRFIPRKLMPGFQVAYGLS